MSIICGLIYKCDVCCAALFYWVMICLRLEMIFDGSGCLKGVHRKNVIHPRVGSRNKRVVKATFTAVKTVKVRPNSRIKYKLFLGTCHHHQPLFMGR